MKETESLRFSVKNLSDQNDSKKVIFKKSDYPNLEDIINFIKNLELNSEVQEKLIKHAKKIPHGSLANFRKNYRIYINKEVK